MARTLHVLLKTTFTLSCRKVKSVCNFLGLYVVFVCRYVCSVCYLEIFCFKYSDFSCLLFLRVRRYLGYDDNYDYWREDQAEQQGKEDELNGKLQESRAELQKQKRHIKQLKSIVKDQSALLKRIAAKLDVDGSDDEDE